MNRDEAIPVSVIKLANYTLGGMGGLFLILFLYIVFRKPSGTVTTLTFYYITPLVFAGLFIASIKLSPLIRVKVTVVTVSSVIAIVIALFSVELFLEYSATSGPLRAAQMAGVEFDKRSRIEMIQDLRSQGVDAHSSVAPFLLLLEEPYDGNRNSVITIDNVETLPLGGISKVETVHCNEGQYLVYGSDEYGFHNPQEIWNSSRLDIVAIGDSYIQGSCVPSDKNIIAKIREDFPATLSLGIAGNGPLVMMAGLQEYLPTLKPKIVLWFYYEGNDLNDLQFERTSPILMRYLEEEFRQGLVDKQAAIDQALIEFLNSRIVEQEAEQSDSTFWTTMVDIIKLKNFRFFVGLIDWWHDTESMADYALFSEILKKSNRITESWGGKLCFVYLPEQSRYYGLKKVNRARERSREKILTLVKAEDITIVDVVGAFKAHEDPAALFPYMGSHYNIEGHSVVAEAVLNSACLNDSE